jgi:hypothetical protein
MNRKDFLSSTGSYEPVIHLDIENDDYLSSQEFVVTDIKRGFSEIRKLHELCIKHGAYIAGGYARHCVTINSKSTDFSDVDVFCQNQGSFDALLAEIKNILEGDIAYLDILQTEYAVTIGFKNLSGDAQFLKNVERAQGRIKNKISQIFPIQIIKPVTIETGRQTGGDIIEILKNFDLDICQVAIVSPVKAICSFSMMASDKDNSMKVSKGLHNPYMTMARVIKYGGRGVRVKAGILQDLFTFFAENTYKKDGCGAADLEEFIKKQGMS